MISFKQTVVAAIVIVAVTAMTLGVGLEGLDTIIKSLTELGQGSPE